MSILEQAYTYAKEEYDKVTKKLDRLDDLRRRNVQEDWEGERAELEKEHNELKERRDKWEAKLQEWGDKLTATAQPGNDFVTQAFWGRRVVCT